MEIVKTNSLESREVYDSIAFRWSKKFSFEKVQEESWDTEQQENQIESIITPVSTQVDKIKSIFSKDPSFHLLLKSGGGYLKTSGKIPWEKLTNIEFIHIFYQE